MLSSNIGSVNKKNSRLIPVRNQTGVSYAPENRQLTVDKWFSSLSLLSQGFTGFIPFLSIIGNGDEIFCFDKDNNIVLLDCYTTGEAAPVEGAFSDCLMKQIAELEERKNKKIRGEDKNN